MIMSLPAALEDLKKVISFQESKRASVWVDLDQLRKEEFDIFEGDCPSLAQSTLQVVPSCTHHSPENW